MVGRRLAKPDNAWGGSRVRSLLASLLRVAVLFALTAILAKYIKPPMQR
jgi:hypothetical protein